MMVGAGSHLHNPHTLPDDQATIAVALSCREIGERKGEGESTGVEAGHLQQIDIISYNKLSGIRPSCLATPLLRIRPSERPFEQTPLSTHRSFSELHARQQQYSPDAFSLHHTTRLLLL